MNVNEQEKVYTDREILEALIHYSTSCPISITNADILKFIAEKKKTRVNFPTMNSILVESDKCLQLVAKRASKYGEAWKDVRVSSLIDYVLMKYHRVNSLVDDLDSNIDKLETDVQDMVNYGLFVLVMLQDYKKQLRGRV